MRFNNRAPALPTQFGTEQYRRYLQEILTEQGQTTYDLVTALSGWRDLMGMPAIQVPGSNTAGWSDPTFPVWRDNIRAFQMSAAKTELWFTYHVDHDFKQNGEMHIHVHWGQNVTDASKVVKFYFDMTFAKGHQQQAFPAAITTSVTQASSGTQYMHNIAEVQIASPTPTATQFDSAGIETDGLLIVRLYRDSADVADTLTQSPFIFQCDIHYETDHAATAFKSPPFR